MEEFKSICMLGRLPALGIAELEALYGPKHIKPLNGAVLLDVPAEEINFNRLGGTIKTGRILAVLDSPDWDSAFAFLKKSLPGQLEHIDSKLTLGISIYGLSVDVDQLNRDLLSLKKVAKAAGRSLRVVPNKELALNSAQVLYNQLTKKGGWELLFVRDGQRTILAQTLFVQNIEAYAARDQARPKRDARVGMLPPKLAQTIVNLAVAQADKQAGRIRVLDPFCGTGVILQEALLMGYSVLGSDLEPRMVEYAKQNLTWLVNNNPNIEGQVALEVGDATSYRWPGFSHIASETYLGRPLNALPEPAKLKAIISDTDTIIKKFLINLAPQLRDKARLCLALPAWRKPSGELIHLPCLAKITEMGYNYVDLKNVRREDLIYYRENQVVARRLIILEKA